MTRSGFHVHGWLLVIGVVLVGCLPGSSTVPSIRGGSAEASRAIPGDETGALRLALVPRNEAGDGGALRGTLRVTGPCLEIVDESGDSWLPVWPDIATWDIEAQVLTLGRTEVGLGEPAEFGGGEGNIGPTNVDDYEWVQRPDESCLPSRAWFVYLLHVET